ncbi:hypothetical protein JCM11251_007772 [Rhodosporidiobolus azoricus]
MHNLIHQICPLLTLPVPVVPSIVFSAPKKPHQQNSTSQNASVRSAHTVCNLSPPAPSPNCAPRRPSQSTPSCPALLASASASPPSSSRLSITPLPSIPVLTFTNSPSRAPPCDNNNSASNITYASGAKTTATVLHEEDLSFPDNQLDNRFALIGDRSWDANALAEFPDAVGGPTEGAAADETAPKLKPSYPAAEEGILAQMSVTETSEDLQAAFEESMRRVRARGIEEGEAECCEAEEKAKVARWREEEWEREKAAEAKRLEQAKKARAEVTERVALAQREWEEEREQSEAKKRLREEAAERAEREVADDERVADSVEPARAETDSIQVSHFILSMPSPKQDAPCTTPPRVGKPANPKTPANPAPTKEIVDDDNPAHAAEDEKWKKVEEAKKRKREAEAVAKARERGWGGRAGALAGKTKPAGGRVGQLNAKDRYNPVDLSEDKLAHASVHYDVGPTHCHLIQPPLQPQRVGVPHQLPGQTLRPLLRRCPPPPRTTLPALRPLGMVRPLPTPLCPL